MNKLYLILLAFCINCTSIKNKAIYVDNDIKLSQFTIDEKNYHYLIVDRKPIYGNGRKDGCSVELQMNLSLNLIKKENSISTYLGKITDSEKDEPLSLVSIQISRKDTTIEDVRSDENGGFKFSSKEDIQKITLSSVGCRKLVIDFTKSNNLL